MDKIALLNEDTFEQSLGDILNLNSRADKHTILLVDDEVNNLQLLRRTLHRDYNILTAANGKEALQIVEDKGKEISLIVSDQKIDRKSTRLNSSHSGQSRMPSSA